MTLFVLVCVSFFAKYPRDMLLDARFLDSKFGSDCLFPQWEVGERDTSGPFSQRAFFSTASSGPFRQGPVCCAMQISSPRGFMWQPGRGVLASVFFVLVSHLCFHQKDYHGHFLGLSYAADAGQDLSPQSLTTSALRSLVLASYLTSHLHMLEM